MPGWSVSQVEMQVRRGAGLNQAGDHLGEVPLQSRGILVAHTDQDGGLGYDRDVPAVEPHRRRRQRRWIAGEAHQGKPDHGIPETDCRPQQGNSEARKDEPVDDVETPNAQRIGHQPQHCRHARHDQQSKNAAAPGHLLWHIDLELRRDRRRRSGHFDVMSVGAHLSTCDKA